MAKSIRMIVVLLAIGSISGGILGPLKALTETRAQANIFRFKKLPGVLKILVGDASQLSPEEKEKLAGEILADKKELKLQGQPEPAALFPLKKDGRPYAVVIESSGKGYGGGIGVMVGFNLETGNLEGIGITTLSETPGVGTRVTEDAFTRQFKGLSKSSIFKIKKDGGSIDGVTGASYSSRGVAAAVGAAQAFFDQHRDEILKEIGR